MPLLNLDDLIQLAQDLVKASEEVREKQGEIGERMQSMPPYPMQKKSTKELEDALVTVRAIGKGLNQLRKTNKVADHRVAALKESANKRDLASIKHLLTKQAAVVKLADKQASMVLKHLDKIAKDG